MEFQVGVMGKIMNYGQIKEVVDPTGNVNLSPFQQWRSAYECLLNTSNSCQDKYQLTEEGWVNVTLADTEEYCKWGGCAQHSRAVLMCLHLVKHDFRFIDKATVQDVNNTITQGCSSGIIFFSAGYQH
ncbi:hypothetical protein L1049_012226 [Liquidambar formosana]|uniref:DUF7731 domain-containing protein n=1 Tax=Liquidambar formosana TaxID=63359 RepID=A0AAP0RSF9_LIQFO